jgi:hypothetical protein
MKSLLAGFALAAAVGFAPLAHAQTADDLLRTLELTARADQPAFAGFSVERGQAFFTQRHGQEWSCSTCHTSDPRVAGRHAMTGKAIQPLAPVANAARLTDTAKVDKWFRRNCKDVLGRECTAAEKGDVIAYLISLKS